MFCGEEPKDVVDRCNYWDTLVDISKFFMTKDSDGDL